jgi:hypothetical protein
MRQLGLLGLATLAVLAIVTGLASTTSGFLLENLPEKAGRTYEGKDVGAALIETVGGTAIECGEGPSTATETTSKPPVGAIHIDFKKCITKKPINGLKCTGTGDAVEEILVLATWQLVFDKNPATTVLTTAILYEPSNFKFECAAGVIKAEVEGDILCLHLNPTVESATHESHCAQNKGKPEETKYWNALGTEKTIAKFEANINGGGFEEAGVLVLTQLTTTEVRDKPLADQ